MARTPDSADAPRTAAGWGPTRRHALVGAAGVAGSLVLGAGLRPDRAAAATTRNISLTRWAGPQFNVGTHVGTLPFAQGVYLKAAAGRTTYVDAGTPRTYEYGEWYSPWVTPTFLFGELVPSWSVFTPDGTWVRVLVETVSSAARTSGWLDLGRWCATDPAMGGAIHRTSVGGQGNAVASVRTDTVVAAPYVGLRNWRLRMQLMRPPRTTLSPTVFSTGAMVSTLPAGPVPVSPVGPARGRVLAVPTLSQELHRGHYPQWDGGGEAWCSATSVAMLAQYWRAGPSASDVSWVRPSVDAQVDYAARFTYDYGYQGCGNWPFSTAYPARWGLDGFVTRLRSLAELEQFIVAGIPVAVSVSFANGELPGAGYGTSGHLLVVVGFTASGDVVVNDPASHLQPSDAQVRTVYPRAAFENVWVPRSGGLAYVVRPTTVPLPPPPAQANWPTL